MMYVAKHPQADRFQFIHGDCMDVFPRLADESVDMVFCDLPYGTTYADWDKALPMAPLWDAYKRIVRGTGAIVLTASQPFTSLLVTSNLSWFRCEWIWDKVNAANFANANRQPLKSHEQVLIFARGQTVYRPQKVQSDKKNHSQGVSKQKQSPLMRIDRRVGDDFSGMKFPKTIQTFPKHASHSKLHPTQKPVELVSYFVETYSEPDAVILDNCMGSGSTAMACKEIGRRFIGIEKDRDYFVTAFKRFYNAV